MTRSLRASVRPLPDTACTAGYEQMRGDALKPGAAHVRCGRAVMVRGGVAAWLDAVAVRPSLPPVAGRQAAPGAGCRTASTVDILVAMIHANMEQEAA